MKQYKILPAELYCIFRRNKLAKVGVTDADLAPGETYKDLGNVRANELATRAMWSGEHSGFSFR